MVTISRDPKGYYAALGLAPGADLAAVKAAYRSRVKAVHPDHNQTPQAREEFQRLSEAYHVLQDRLHRVETGQTGTQMVQEDEVDELVPSSPYACSCCGVVTAQPRYVQFHKVKSFLIWAKTSRVEGIFCRSCADAAAVRASTLTWLWGWWSPMGLLLAPLALLRNLMGGTKPARENARLLIGQARAFQALGDVDIARSLAEQARTYARGPRQHQHVQDILAATAQSRRRLRGRWAPWASSVFLLQALPLLALPVVMLLLYLIFTQSWTSPVAARAAILIKQPEAGDILHVAGADLKLRQGPQNGAPVLALLDRFSTVRVLSSTRDGNWIHVAAPSGVEGWVPSRALYAGSAEATKKDWCAANLGEQPSPGEVLVRRAGGDHRLLIHNDGGHDAVVKLKTMTGNTVVSYYVPASYHIGVGGIPAGTYRIEFATGIRYSRACGLFVDGMLAQSMPYALTYRQLPVGKSQAQMATVPEISLIAAPSDPRYPQPLDQGRFALDD